jgi:predicted  nucleic acid-binding Zn-ribbon protein
MNYLYYFTRPFYRDEFFNEFIDTLTFHPNLKTYNPNEYELKLKDGVIEKRIKEREEQIRRLESQRDLEKAGWDNQIKQLQTDIEELKKKLNP